MWMIPQLPTASGATIWIAAFGEGLPPQQVVIDAESSSATHERRFTPAWKVLREDETMGLWYARVELDGLAANERYTLWLRPDGGPRFGAPALLRTLPTRIPGPHEAPFVIMLGSCFDYRGSGAPAIADFRRLLADYRFPHLKVICGDQIYFDLPITESIPDEPNALFRFLFGKYLRNWAPEGAPLASGLGSLLRHGGNLLVTDDHEFWNNYPFVAPHIPSTYTASRRELLARLSRGFIRAFQVDYPAEISGTHSFTEVTIGEPGAPGSLVILAIDGRFDRCETRAHWPADLDRLCERLRDLESPAMLVLSQPLFEPTLSFFRRRIFDSGIPDLGDYDPLAAAIAAAPHEIMILSGDIHCGRIAEIRPGGSRLGAGRKIVEVVASPLSLIAGTGYGDGPAFRAFPSRPLIRPAQAVARAVEPRVGPICSDHAVILEVSAKHRSLEATASFWSIRERQLLAKPEVITLT